MRKMILITVMTVLIVLLGYTVYAGISLGNFEILSYIGLDEKSKNLDIAIREYDDKNSQELAGKQKQLTTQISSYEEQKQKYEEILIQKQNDLLQIDTANCYEVDFLWTKIGNYATQHGLDLEFNITKNAADPGKSEYVLTDLNFSVTGDYQQITEFISALEKDERLEFEIRNFNMKRETIKENDIEKKILKATFKVFSVAINKATLTDLTAPVENNLNTNTTNTTTSNTTNTTSNAVSGNTTNQ